MLLDIVGRLLYIKAENINDTSQLTTANYEVNLLFINSY